MSWAKGAKHYCIDRRNVYSSSGSQNIVELENLLYVQSLFSLLLMMFVPKSANVRRTAESVFCLLANLGLPAACLYEPHIRPADLAAAILRSDEMPDRTN